MRLLQAVAPIQILYLFFQLNIEYSHLYREQPIYVEYNCVSHGLKKHWTVNESPKMLQANPFTASNTKARHKILESNEHSVHGKIVENEDINYREQ